LFGDNLGFVQNATMKDDSLLKKNKHVAISYHKVREAAAASRNSKEIVSFF
jgi:hypothetical protein